MWGDAKKKADCPVLCALVLPESSFLWEPSLPTTTPFGMEVHEDSEGPRSFLRVSLPPSCKSVDAYPCSSWFPQCLSLSEF